MPAIDAYLTQIDTDGWTHKHTFDNHQTDFDYIYTKGDENVRIVGKDKYCFYIVTNEKYFSYAYYTLLNDGQVKIREIEQSERDTQKEYDDDSDMGSSVSADSEYVKYLKQQLADKEKELENVKKERDTAIISGGRVVYVADPEKVSRLENEIASLKREIALYQ